METNRTLGICIPTYKRPDQLRRCALSVIRAAEPYGVPVFIADDSTDATNAAVIEELQARYSYIRYFRNPRNLGIDANIVHVIDLCDCEYAWPLGEDDRMTEGGIATALEALKNNPAFICANYAAVDEHIAVVLKERALPFETDICLSAETFFTRYAWAIGFMGGCILQKAGWRAVDSGKYLGTYYAHVGTILEAIHGQEMTIIAQPLVLNRCGGAHVFTWSEDSDGVFGGWAEMTRRLLPLYGAAACAEAAASFEAAHGLHTLKFLCGQRADGLYNLSAFRARIRPTERSLAYKLAAWLIALGSPALFRTLRRAREQHRQRHSRPVIGIE